MNVNGWSKEIAVVAIAAVLMMVGLKLEADDPDDGSGPWEMHNSLVVMGGYSIDSQHAFTWLYNKETGEAYLVKGECRPISSFESCMVPVRSRGLDYRPLD